MSFYYKFFSFLLLFFFLITSSLLLTKATDNNDDIIIDLINRDSPLSPFYNPSETDFYRLKKSLNRSLSTISSLSSFESSLIQSTVSANRGQYVAQLNIGTPPVKVIVLVDTGSDLTWTQCTPCTKCFKQDSLIFDPTKSKTYKRTPCSSQQCKPLGKGAFSCDKSSSCNYQISYRDRSFSNGELASDTLTFDDKSSFPNFSLGCGHQNDFSSELNTGSGVLGLSSASSLSIIQQLDKSIGGKFCYCLVPPLARSTSKMSFGNAAVVSGRNVVSTPLTVNPFYRFTLLSVSVGNTKVEPIVLRERKSA